MLPDLPLSTTTKAGEQSENGDSERMSLGHRIPGIQFDRKCEEK